MDFIMLTTPYSALAPVTLSADRLVLRATKETKERHLSGKGSDRAQGAGHVLWISGKLLLQLCAEEWQVGQHASAAPIDIDKLHCVLICHAHEAFRGGLRLIPSDELGEHLFDVPVDLLPRNRLWVFTRWDNLAQVAVLPGRVPTLTAEGGGTSTSTGKRPRMDEAGGGLMPHTKHISAAAGRSPRFTFSRAEMAFETVDSMVTKEDRHILNVLLERGIIPANTALKEYLCSSCSCLPSLTLTMSCCGSVLCPSCVPTPPTVEGVSREDRVCRICEEEPLDPPKSHPARDEMVAALTRELRVLYFPQFRAVRDELQRSGSEMDQHRPYGMGATPPNRTPVLGGAI